MSPSVCCEPKPQMCPCNYSTAWADRSWEQNSQTINESVTQEKTLNETKKVSQLCSSLNSLHELSLDFSFIKCFTVNETPFSHSLEREPCKPQKGKAGAEVVTFISRAQLGFNTCVPFIVLVVEGMLPGSCAEFASKTCFNFRVTSQKPSVSRRGWAKRMQSCWLRIHPLLLHCLWYFDCPYPTKADLPAGLGAVHCLQFPPGAV